ncbi:MAG: YdbH domain-containing protein [Alphaproteobacteria bacterium]|nr:YdbH domain-containing protein [Alphaproteobacteria bacterium]
MAMSSVAVIIAIHNSPVSVAQYYLEHFFSDRHIKGISSTITEFSYTHASIKAIRFNTTQPSSIDRIDLNYRILETNPFNVDIDTLTIHKAIIHATVNDGKFEFGSIVDQLRTLSANTAPQPSTPPAKWNIHHIEVNDSVLYVHYPNQTTVLPFTLTIEPLKEGFKGHLNIPMAKLVLLDYPLGEIGKLTVEGQVKGDVDFKSTPEATQILSSKFSSLVPGTIKFVASDSIMQKYAEQPQMQLLLQALSNYHFQVADIVLASDKNHRVKSSLTLKGTNPELANGRNVNININLNGNLFDLLSQNPYDVPPAVKSFIQSIGEQR